MGEKNFGSGYYSERINDRRTIELQAWSYVFATENFESGEKTAKDM